MTRLRTSTCRARSATSTTARCSTSRRTSTRSSSRRPITMHAPIALAAMDRRQARLRAEAADMVGRGSARLSQPRDAKPGWRRRWATRVTRGTTRGPRSSSVWAGAIGDVREVHIWTNRPLGYWPQGIPRPEAATVALDELPLERTRRHDADRQRARWPAATPCPKKLAWDLFLGRRAARRLSPGLSPVQLARLGRLGRRRASATWARTSSIIRCGRSISAIRRRSKRSRRRSTASAIPHATMTFYEFPARGDKPPVKLTWYDGGFAAAEAAGDGRRGVEQEAAARCSSAARASCCTTPTAGSRGCCPSRCTSRSASRPQKLPRIPERESRDELGGGREGHDRRRRRRSSTPRS